MTVTELHPSAPEPGPDFGRTPPQDLAAEQSVLGACMISAAAFDEVTDLGLRGPDFYRPAHETILDAVRALHQRREPVDGITVANELLARGDLAKVGGSAYLHTLQAAVPTAANVAFYARIVRERAVLRRLVMAGTKVVHLGYATDGGNVDEIVNASVAEVSSVADSVHAAKDETLDDIADRALAMIEEGDPAVPTPWGFLNDVIGGTRPGRFYAIGARPGVGKALALDTPLPTPTGWTTMGDVQVGDYVIGADGKPTRIMFATDVQHDRECFEVEFSDGSVITADADHLWLTDDRASRKSAWAAENNYNRSRNQCIKPAVRTTREIFANLRVPTDCNRLNYSVRNCKPFDLPDADLPIDPYLLGVWLGDGWSYGARISTADPEIVMAFEDAGYKVRHVANYDYAVNGGLLVQLRGLGLIGKGSKHIPAIYARASERQRRDLLAGLLDSDGTATKLGLVQFSVTLERLAMGTRELISSLGYRTGLTTKVIKGARPDSSIAYTLSFAPPDKVFRLQRKLARQVSSTGRYTRDRMISDVRPVQSVPVKCIQVDNSDHMYLAGRTCIPTHNTILGLQWAIAHARHQRVRGMQVAYFTFEMTAERLYQRALSSASGVSGKAMQRGRLTDAEWRKVIDADIDLRSLPLRLVGASGWSPQQVRAKARQMHRARPVGLVVVDHIGLTRPERSGGKESRQAELSEAADVFLGVAHELSTPVMVMTQLNRGSTTRQDQRPVPTDVRDTDRIEQNADVLMLLHRDKDNHPEEMWVAVAKHREGEEQSVKLRFDGPRSRVE